MLVPRRFTETCKFPKFHGDLTQRLWREHLWRLDRYEISSRYIRYFRIHSMIWHNDYIMIVVSIEHVIQHAYIYILHNWILDDNIYVYRIHIFIIVCIYFCLRNYIYIYIDTFLFVPTSTDQFSWSSSWTVNCKCSWVSRISSPVTTRIMKCFCAHENERLNWHLKITDIEKPKKIINQTSMTLGFKMLMVDGCIKGVTYF